MAKGRLSWLVAAPTSPGLLVWLRTLPPTQSGTTWRPGLWSAHFNPNRESQDKHLIEDWDGDCRQGPKWPNEVMQGLLSGAARPFQALSEAVPSRPSNLECYIH